MPETPPPTAEELQRGFEELSRAWKDRFIGRLVCQMGTVEYRGSVEGTVTITVTCGYVGAKRCLEALLPALTPQSPVGTE